MGITIKKRARILERDGFACFYCGLQLHNAFPQDEEIAYSDPRLVNYLNIDHLNPQKNGRNDDESNLVACCRACNSSKGGRTLESFRAFHEAKHPWVRARQALELARSLVKLPQDGELEQAIKLLAWQNTKKVFPGEKRLSELAQKATG